MKIVLIVVLVQEGQALRLVVLLDYLPLAEDDLRLLLERNVRVQNYFHVLTNEVSFDFEALLACLRIAALVDQIPQIIQEYFLFRSTVKFVFGATCCKLGALGALENAETLPYHSELDFG